MRCAAFGLNFPTSYLWVFLSYLISFLYIFLNDPFTCFVVFRWSLNVTSVKRLSLRWTKPSFWFPLSSLWVSSSVSSGKSSSDPHPHPPIFLSHLQSALSAFPLRTKIALDPSQTLFLLVAERSMSCMSSSMGDIYSRFRDADGFLYITYASQEVFGASQLATGPCWWGWWRWKIKWTEPKETAYLIKPSAHKTRQGPRKRRLLGFHFMRNLTWTQGGRLFDIFISV